MIGLDTNILARCIVLDDPNQVTSAKNVLESLHHKGRKSFINIIVLCELIWLLGSKYGYTRRNLVEVIEILLHNDDFVVEDSAAVAEALAHYNSSKDDFAGILIGLRNRKAGCNTTLTFDQNAATLDEFTLLA